MLDGDQNPRDATTLAASLLAASLAASALEGACNAANPEDPRFGAALELTRAYAAELDTLVGSDPAVAVVEGALLAADLASLAACAAADLSEGPNRNGGAPPPALASALSATHLCVGAALALHALAEEARRAGVIPPEALADAASAAWKARFAARQAEGVRDAVSSV